MKNINKIFIVIITSCTIYTTQAQPISKADAQVIKDIQNTILLMKDKVDNGFDSYIVGDEMARDSSIIQYQAANIKLLHAKENLVLKNVDNSGSMLSAEYANKKDILLANTALLGMPKYAGNKWTFKAKLDVADTVTAKYLLYNDKPIGFFMKGKKNEFLYFYFLHLEINNNDTSIVANKDSIMTYMSDNDRQQDSVDNTIAKPDSIKIENLQTAFANLVAKGKDGFIDMIFDESNRDEDIIYYKAVFQIHMKAQNCQGIKLLPKGGKYFVCTYTQKENVSIAVKAIDGLQGNDVAGWYVQPLELGDTNLVGKKIFLDGNYIAYTTLMKDTNQFFIAVKNQLFKEELVVPKKKVVSKKKK